MITARVTGSLKNRSAVRRSSRRISAETSSGEIARPAASWIHVSPFGASVELVRQHAREPADLGMIEAAAEQALGAEDRQVGAVVEALACRLADDRALGENHTSDGSVVEPSSVVRMRGAPSRSITATTEFVVPRSMPTARPPSLKHPLQLLGVARAVTLTCSSSLLASAHWSWCASAVSSWLVASMTSPSCSAATAVAT